MSRVKVIGLHGFKRAGKTTFGTMLEERGCYVTSFAKRVYQSVQVMYNLRDEELADEYKNIKHPIWGLTLREMLILVGHSMGREMYNPYLWLIHIQEELKGLDTELMKEPIFVVTDVRYQNEADWIRNNGVLIHIIKDGIEGSEHESEKGIAVLDDDLIVHNLNSPEWRIHLQEEAEGVIALING